MIKEKVNPETLKNIPVHFIVGLGRSGTTLVTSILNNHPQVLSAPESRFILYCLQPYKDKKSFTKTEADEFMDIIFSIKESRFVSLKFWFIDKEKLRKDIYSFLPDISFKELCKLVYLNSYLSQGKSGVKVIIDKNPPYTLHLEKFMKLFPGAKFIGLTRDYRDNALSRHQFHFDSIKSIIYHGIIWNEYNRNLVRAGKKYPGRMLLLRYEDMVNNPEENITRIYNFLGIDPSVRSKEDPAAYKGYFDKILSELKPHEQEIFMQMHGRVIQKVDASKVDKWKSQLPPYYIACLDYVCGKTGGSFGYKNAPEISAGVSPWTKLLIYFQKLYRLQESFIHRNYYRSPVWLRKYARSFKNSLRKIAFQPKGYGEY